MLIANLKTIQSQIITVLHYFVIYLGKYEIANLRYQSQWSVSGHSNTFQNVGYCICTGRVPTANLKLSLSSLLFTPWGKLNLWTVTTFSFSVACRNGLTKSRARQHVTRCQFRKLSISKLFQENDDTLHSIINFALNFCYPSKLQQLWASVERSSKKLRSMHAVPDPVSTR